MDVAEEDAVVIRGLLPIVESQGDDVLEEVRVLERLEGGVEIALVRQVDAFQDGSFRVQKIALVSLAGEAVFGQVAVSAGTRPSSASQVETELLTASVTPRARVSSCTTITQKQQTLNKLTELCV